MAYPPELKYTKDHEWIRISGDTAEIGITSFAQEQLGDIVYVELPETGRAITAGEVFGTIESVKAVSELFSPISGEVVAVNDDLGLHPDSINKTPHDTWIVRIRPDGPEADAALLDAAAYGDLVQ